MDGDEENIGPFRRTSARTRRMATRMASALASSDNRSQVTMGCILTYINRFSKPRSRLTTPASSPLPSDIQIYSDAIFIIRMRGRVFFQQYTIERKSDFSAIAEVEKGSHRF